jgi:hypothetical protein
VFINDFQKVHLARLEKMARTVFPDSLESVEKEVNRVQSVNLGL